VCGGLLGRTPPVTGVTTRPFALIIITTPRSKFLFHQSQCKSCHNRPYDNEDPKPGRAAFGLHLSYCAARYVSLWLVVPMLPKLIEQFKEGDMSAASRLRSDLWIRVRRHAIPVCTCAGDSVGSIRAAADRAGCRISEWDATTFSWRSRHRLSWLAH